MARNKTMLIGALMLLTAAIIGALAFAWGVSGRAVYTDNAYVRGDITSLAPKVAGYVTAVEVSDNQAVRAGDVLFRIDDRDYRARLAQAQADLDAAKARLANAAEEVELQGSLVRQARAQRQSTLAELSLATKTSVRRHELIEGGGISQALVDESDSAVSRAEAGVAASSAAVDAQRQKVDVLVAQQQAAVAAVAQAEAARELARIDLENTVVRAPVSGVIGNRQVRVGRLVSPGTPLLDIVPVAQVYVVANFKETQLRNLRPGAPVRIEIDGYPGITIRGSVESLAPGSGSAFSLFPADNATGNFVRVVQRVPVKIRLHDNPLPGRLLPGLSARVEVVRGSS